MTEKRWYQNWWAWLTSLPLVWLLRSRSPQQHVMATPQKETEPISTPVNPRRTGSQPSDRGLPAASRVRDGRATAAVKAHLADKAASWKAAPSTNCDICNSWEGEHNFRIPNNQFRHIVRLGYHPASSGGLNSAWRAALGFRDELEWYEDWKSRVFQHTTDWGLCRGCAQDVKKFLGVT